MRVLLYADAGAPFEIRAVCASLNRVCKVVDFEGGKVPLLIPSAVIRAPATYGSLDPALRSEAETVDLAVLATGKPYSNNYFWDAEGKRVIVSLHGWGDLTDLPANNGLAFFAAALIVRARGVGVSHQANTGCVNDFWWDKRGIDASLRAAYLCGECMTAGPRDGETSAILGDVRAILDLVAHASRDAVDLGSPMPVPTPDAGGPFDVFLCHNAADKPDVRRIDERLKGLGLRTWLDEEQLPPGLPWQTELEKVIGEVRSAMVFVGGSGVGPWQNLEMRAFLNEFANRGCPVVPVLLPGAPDAPELPIFLRQMTWADLREDSAAPLQRLAAYLARANA